MKLLNRFKSSALIKAFLVGALIVVLQIPLGKIISLMYERESTKESARAEVSSMWGDRQRIAGPILSLPYRVRGYDSSGKRVVETHNAYYLPTSLNIKGRVTTQVRYKGIFKVPLYTAQVQVEGEFCDIAIPETEIPRDDILWDQATLIVGMSTPRALTKNIKLQWGEHSLDFIPETGAVTIFSEGIHAELSGEQAKGTHKFSFELNARGSSNLSFLPLGAQSTALLSGTWPDPAFSGAYLPGERTIDATGFEASWNIPNLGRGYPQRWRDSGVSSSALEASNFGVGFVVPVDAYRMSLRASKYELLFIFLTFLTFYLFETMGRLFIHPLQYLVVGAGICLFYLLLLSIAEHLSFIVAYVIASSAIVALVTAYSAAVLQTGKKGLIVGSVLSSLYAFLYVLLSEQDYSLLAGSGGLTVVLAVVMGLTRRMNRQEDHGRTVS